MFSGVKEKPNEQLKPFWGFPKTGTPTWLLPSAKVHPVGIKAGTLKPCLIHRLLRWQRVQEPAAVVFSRTRLGWQMALFSTLLCKLCKPEMHQSQSTWVCVCVLLRLGTKVQVGVPVPVRSDTLPRKCTSNFTLKKVALSHGFPPQCWSGGLRTSFNQQTVRCTSP